MHNREQGTITIEQAIKNCVSSCIYRLTYLHAMHMPLAL